MRGRNCRPPLPTGDQVLNVTVGWPSNVTLPADAVITVSLLDVSRDNLPLDERTLAQPGAQPVAFQLAYKAEEIQPPHRARLEARISYGGRLRLISNRQRNFVTTSNAAGTFALTVDPLGGTAPAAAVSGGAGIYVVNAGDTLASIVQHADVTLMDLVLANPGLDPEKIKAGQKLNLPVGK
jgi:uncharacterized lipoprotein YbaY